jgi:hypothetical protein
MAGELLHGCHHPQWRHDLSRCHQRHPLCLHLHHGRHQPPGPEQFDQVLSQLSGAGDITNNSGTGRTLTFGLNNANTTFDGRFLAFNDAVLSTLNVSKIGSGSFGLTGGDSTSTATFNIYGGAVTYSGTASTAFGSYSHQPDRRPSSSTTPGPTRTTASAACSRASRWPAVSSRSKATPLAAPSPSAH